MSVATMLVYNVFHSLFLSYSVFASKNLWISKDKKSVQLHDSVNQVSKNVHFVSIYVSQSIMCKKKKKDKKPSFVILNCF